MQSARLNETIKTISQELGFDLVGVASVDDPLLTQAVERYKQWLDAGHAASMDYLSRHSEKKKNPSLAFAQARSVICVGLNYGSAENFKQDETRPEISTYTRGSDYHELLSRKLSDFSTRLNLELQIDSWPFVDAQPVLERFWGWRAGLGWIGKNAMLIHRKKGSYFFLGGLLTNAELEPDTADTDHCGRCRKCIDACPTQAILPNRQIESGRCIAYHTIENRGPIPSELHAQFGRWLAGCDICQRVCPWNDPIEESAHFTQSNPAFGESFEELSQWDVRTFKEKTNGIAMQRMKYHGFLRNLAIAASNAVISSENKMRIFDRIRENSSFIEKQEFKTVVLDTLNVLQKRLKQ